MVVSFSLPSTRRGNSLDGSTSRRAIPMPVDPTWLTENGLELKSVADMYVDTIHRHRGGKYLADGTLNSAFITWEEMSARMGLKNVSDLQGRIL